MREKGFHRIFLSKFFNLNPINVLLFKNIDAINMLNIVNSTQNIYTVTIIIKLISMKNKYEM